MTKKDYELIAAAVRETRRALSDDDGALGIFCGRLADKLQADNSRFSESRFLAACRGEDSHDSAGRRVRYSSSVDSTSIRAPKTGAPCGCRRGVERDNCPSCEGTGQRIDFRAIHAARSAS